MTQTSYNHQTLATYLASDGITPATAMTANLVSAPFNLNQKSTFAMQFVWTGTPAGNLKVIGSLDGVNYNVPIDTHAAGGAAGTYTYDMGATAGLSTSCGWVRAEYAFTSSTGTLSLVQVASKYPSII
jgi:hypothetical protein